MNEYTYEEIKTGLEESFEKKITKEDILKFSEITGDKNPLHLDEEYAKTTPFKKNIVYGMFPVSLFSTLAGMYLPGRYSLILSSESYIKKPCFEGDILKISGKVDKKIDAGKLIILKIEIKNQENEKIIEGKMIVQVLK